MSENINLNVEEVYGTNSKSFSNYEKVNMYNEENTD